MTDLPFRPVVVLVAALAAALAGGCTSTGTIADGSTPRTSRSGPWQNFRAEVPIVQPGPTAMLSANWWAPCGTQRRGGQPWVVDIMKAGEAQPPVPTTGIAA
jgi:hypothetical protein